jgi:hypothetical protein
MRVVQGLIPALDVTCNVVYDDLISLGVGYRNQTAVIAHLQLALFDYIKVGYSYDFGISDIRIASASSHEITIALSACDRGSKKAEHCSAYD